MVAKKKEIKEETKLEKYALTKIDGVGSTRMNRLKDFGINCIQDVCMRAPQDLVRIANLDLDKAEEMWMSARKALDEIGEIRSMKMSSKDLYLYQKALPTLASNCEAFDILFGGKGPKRGTLTEIYGAFGSGKSQYLFTMTVEALNKGLAVLFIDCEDTFTGGDGMDRLIEIAVAKGYLDKNDEEAQMIFIEKLEIEGATNSTEAKYVLNHISNIMIEKEIKLIIMDGAIGLFRKDFHGRGELSVRQDYLKDLMSMIGSVPLFFDCWAIMSNQVQTDPGVFFGDPTKPIGGNVVGHEATYRMYVKVLSDQKWQAKMVDSPHHAKQAITFRLGKKGVEDHVEELEKYKKALAKIEKEEAEKEAGGLDVEKVEIKDPEVTVEKIDPQVQKERDIIIDNITEDTQGLIKKDLLLENDSTEEITLG